MQTCHSPNLTVEIGSSLFSFPHLLIPAIGYNKRIRHYCAVGIPFPHLLIPAIDYLNTAKEGIIATQRAFARPALLVAMIPSKHTY